MSQVRINANIPAGDIEIIVPLHLSISDSGTRNLRETLIEASNRVLRAYGSEPINHQEPAAPEPTSSGPHRLSENHNADPVCTCGWDPAGLLLGINDRETAREAIRDHILERGGR